MTIQKHERVADLGKSRAVSCPLKEEPQKLFPRRVNPQLTMLLRLVWAQPFPLASLLNLRNLP